MTRMKLYTIFVFSILLMSNLLVLNPVSADSHILPQIGEGDISPLIDGNITTAEWNSSVSFETSLNGDDTSIYVTTNTTHLFIGFNMSVTNFVAVNNTVPVFNATIANYTLGYNNATHDWFALIIDNNLDKAIEIDSIGTAESSDDVVVIDRYRSGGYDASTNGSDLLFIPDTDITYTGPLNDTILTGNGGNDTLDVARNTTNGQVNYEIVKSISSPDELGHDFMLQQLGVLQFKLMRWSNSVANDTLTEGSGTVDQSEWFSLRIADEGLGLASQNAGNTTIQIVYTSDILTNLDALDTFTNLYGFDTTFRQLNENVTYSDYDLTIAVLDSGTISSNTVAAMSSAVRAGANLVFLLGETTGTSNLANSFEVEHLRNSVIMELNQNETTTDVPISSVTTDLKLSNEQTAVTNQNVTSLLVQTSALNISSLTSDNRFILGQEYLAYDLFELPAEFVYDASGDEFVNDTESLDGLSLGVAMDFLKGGRVAILPSASFAIDNELSNENNAVFMLRLVSWVSQMMDTLQISSTAVDMNELDEGQFTTVTVNMTDAIGNALDNNPTVIAEILLAGNVIKTIILTQIGNTAIFEGQLSVDTNGYMQVEFTGYVNGYGFAEGETKSIFVSADVFSYNDLSELSIVTIIIFVLAMTIAFFVNTRVKKLLG